MVIIYIKYFFCQVLSSQGRHSVLICFYHNFSIFCPSNNASFLCNFYNLPEHKSLWKKYVKWQVPHHINKENSLYIFVYAIYQSFFVNHYFHWHWYETDRIFFIWTHVDLRILFFLKYFYIFYSTLLTFPTVSECSIFNLCSEIATLLRPFLIVFKRLKWNNDMLMISF